MKNVQRIFCHDNTKSLSKSLKLSLLRSEVLTAVNVLIVASQVVMFLRITLNQLQHYTASQPTIDAI
jgi:hypothetical protein